MVAWLNAVAAVVGPISVIIGLPGVVIGTVVGVLKVRRWVVTTVIPQQAQVKVAAEQATEAANHAARQATDAAASSRTASDRSDEAEKQARASKETSLQAGQALIELAGMLGEERVARVREAKRHDRLWSAYLDLLREQQPHAWRREQDAAEDAPREQQEVLDDVP